LKLPAVLTIVRDEEKGVEYHVYAYRRLKRAEAVAQVRLARADKKFKEPKKGRPAKILSIIGHDE